VNVPTTIDALPMAGQSTSKAPTATRIWPRAMLAAFAEALMSARPRLQCNAAYGERTDERETPATATGCGVGHPGRLGRPGCPEAPPGRLFHRSFLLQPGARHEKLGWPWICQAYAGRGVDQEGRRSGPGMGTRRISQSEVSRGPRARPWVAEFRNRPLDAGPYRYLWIDGVTQG